MTTTEASVLQRRQFLVIGASGVALAACATSNATTLDMAKAYLDAGSAAVLVAAQQFLAGPPKPTTATAEIVTAFLADLQKVKTTLDTVTAVGGWQAAATQALADMQQLTPLVAVFLGAAAPYVPLAIAVVQAFLAGLPPPAAAPVTPPAVLKFKAAQYSKPR